LVPLQDIHNGEAHILFGLMMITLTFPIGYALMTVIGLSGFLLDRYLGAALPSNEVMLGPLWLSFLVAGYYQWFIWTPKLWSFIRGKNAT
jgi:hypothetical protein